MGGILILFSMSVSLLLWMDLANVFTWILFITTVFLGYLGGIDDYLKLRFRNSKGLRARHKFILQTGFAALIAIYLLVPAVTRALSGQKILRPPTAKEQIVKTKTLSTRKYIEKFYMPFMKDPLFQMNGFFAFLLIVFVITGTSNAVNLTDGLDGLASGCLVMVSLVLALFAFLSNHFDLARYLNILYIEGSGEIGIYLFVMAGACLGFFWYNGYPAQVFMGDTGSLALGGILGVAAVLLRRD